MDPTDSPYRTPQHFLPPPGGVEFPAGKFMALIVGPIAAALVGLVSHPYVVIAGMVCMFPCAIVAGRMATRYWKAQGKVRAGVYGFWVTYGLILLDIAALMIGGLR